jgi:hypothetical protein
MPPIAIHTNDDRKTMNKRTPEEQRLWLIEQTERCLRLASQPIDAKLVRAMENVASEYMAELDRLTADRKKTSEES